MASTNAAIFRQEFTNTLERVIGEHPAHNILAGLSRPVKGGGESTWIAGIDAFASDDATSASYADDSTLKKFHELDTGDQDFAAWLETRTPYNQTIKISSLSDAQLIEWGNTWNLTEDADWLTVVDPKSADMGVCAQKIHKQLDKQFAQAVIATTVQRKVAGAGVAAIPMPATQVMADLTYATATVDTIPAMIHETLGNAYLSAGMPVYCAVSTTLARNLKKNSSDLLRSRDFISSYANYAAGNLPTVEGITFIEMPKAFMEAVKPNAGSTGTITLAAENATAGVDFTLNSAADLLVGDTITIAGTTDYNGANIITAISGSVVTVGAATWVDSQTGTWASDATVVDHYFAWCPQAIASVSYNPLMIDIAEDPGAKFNEVAYVSQLQDFVRTDDKGVVIGDIKSA